MLNDKFILFNNDKVKLDGYWLLNQIKIKSKVHGNPTRKKQRRSIVRHHCVLGVSLAQIKLGRIDKKILKFLYLLFLKSCRCTRQHCTL